MEAIRNLTNEELLRLSNEESKKITKESIVTAVVLLCAEKPFEKITVTEIVRKAGVSRTAFYRRTFALTNSDWSLLTRSRSLALKIKNVLSVFARRSTFLL